MTIDYMCFESLDEVNEWFKTNQNVKIIQINESRENYNDQSGYSHYKDEYKVWYIQLD